MFVIVKNASISMSTFVVLVDGYSLRSQALFVCCGRRAVVINKDVC